MFGQWTKHKHTKQCTVGINYHKDSRKMQHQRSELASVLSYNVSLILTF